MRTKDLGVHIRDAINLLEDAPIDRLDWDKDDVPIIEEDDDVKPFISEIDVSHGFDNLVITDNSGAKFRVLITRIG